MRLRFTALLILIIIVTVFSTLHASERLFLLRNVESSAFSSDTSLDQITGIKTIRPLHTTSILDNTNRLNRWYIIDLDNNADKKAVIETLSNNPSVELIEEAPQRQIFGSSLDGLPDDPLIIYQWHLDAINAYAAWDMVNDASDVIIGLPDLGIQMNHPDLIRSFWTNEAELNGTNGVDDDGNGYIDDIHGWDAVEWDGDPSPSAGVIHGTHVAGLAGASHDNGIGVSGVAPGAQIMALRIGSGSSFQAGPDAYAIVYAIENGVDIISMSYGGTQASMLEKDVMDYAASQGVVTIAAAGNNGRNEANYPAAYPGVISVGATDANNNLSSLSNWGRWVDIAAPGEGIFSTIPTGYGYASGTSMATPIIAGIAGLIIANEPGISPGEVRSRLMFGSMALYPVSLDYISNGAASAWRSVRADQPTLELESVQLQDLNDDGILQPGESFQVIANLELFGGDAENIRLGLFNMNTAVTGWGNDLQTDITVGRFASNPMPASVSSIIDRGSYRLGLGITVDGHSDTLTINVPVDPPWRTHQAGEMLISVTDFGAIGYWDYVNHRESPGGVRFEDSPQGLLFHGSVMVAHNDEVSDCAFGDMDNRSYDFNTVIGGNIRPVETASDSQVYVAEYADGDIRIRQTTLSFPDDESYLIITLDIKNQGNDTEEVTAGIFCDWDIRPNMENEVFYNHDLKLSYMTGTIGAGGITALDNDLPLNIRAIDNTLYIYPRGVPDFNDYDKLLMLTSGMTMPESDNPGDWSHIVAVDLGEIAADESATARFAIIAGRSEEELFNATRRVRTIAGDGPSKPPLQSENLPSNFSLSPPHPNPFNNSVNLTLNLPDDGFVTLEVRDILGRHVALIHQDNLTAGSHKFTWKALSSNNKPVASGVYLVKAAWNNQKKVAKVNLLK
ncbi:MAG: S8 family serine peptidase [Candidatus Electryonea clarkiae]|nr:S8 family serine peptidase [Candidatus Electryonea clarkiae]MDP8285362.1 S8 family serine peptidase [Candidatus Electryonea clarkiae]